MSTAVEQNPFRHQIARSIHAAAMVLSILLLGCFVAAPAQAQLAWTVGRTNVPAVSSATSVAYGNGRFVVCVAGSTAGAVWSTDGVNWTASATHIPTSGSIVFTAGAFYAVGNADIYRSTDGNSWQRIYTGSRGLRSIATNGRSMIVGASAVTDVAVLYSPDLTTWILSAPLIVAGTGDRDGIQKLAYFRGRYYVAYSVGPVNQATYYVVASTTDGTSWTAEPSLDNTIEIASGNGRLVASSVMFPYPTTITTDGISYSFIVPASFHSGPLQFAGGRFIFTGSSAISSDGINWSSLAPLTLPTATIMEGVAYGNGRYVAVGYGPYTGGPTSDVIATLAVAGSPVITKITSNQTVTEGKPVSLTVSLENADTSTAFQWKRNDTAIAGATAPTLTIAAAAVADGGRYTCDVRNSAGTSTSDESLLTVIPITDVSRLTNLSVLIPLDSADDVVTVGFVIGGAGVSGTKSLLARAGGPALTQFAVSNPNPDPRLELYAGTNKIDENDNWSGASTLQNFATQVGAFPFLASDSKDAALIHAVTPGDYSIRVNSSTHGLGSVIAEIYDGTSSSNITFSTPRLINFSANKLIQGGSNLTAGFVVAGVTSRTVLIRAIGPGLNQFGVSGTLADPKLTVFRNGTPAAIAANDDWGGDAAIKAATTGAGAFGFADTSKDAAVLLTLDPGNYSAQATGATGGLVQVEIYDVTP
jgi:hypothetical protein